MSRWARSLVLAVVTGVVTGLLVAGFEHVAGEVLVPRVLDADVRIQAIAPFAGLLVAWALLHAGRSRSSATADEYIRAYHGDAPFELRPVVPRLLASLATLGAGAPLGYEGPSIYAGAAVGAGLHRRLRRLVSLEDARVLLVAGAAAGVAAIFKAPVTGLVFALEVPYQEDLARRMLLPAALSAATSYVVFVSIAGTEPLLPVAGQPPFDLVDLGGAALIGAAAGGLARAFVHLVRMAKTLSTRGHPLVRVLGAGAALAVCVLAGEALDDGGLVLGPGYEALRWALSPERSLVAIFVLATLRVAGTAATVAGGGVGGLFIPLVMQGALLGRFMSGLFDEANATLFPVVGMAAFLGAGYRVPLASVVFVAEFTGRPGFVVPGLIAAVVAQLLMGRDSVSPYQVAGRVGHLERRLRMPLRDVVDTEARTVPPDATLDELFWQHLVAGRVHSVPVVEGSTYLGMATSDDIHALDRSEWRGILVRDIVRADAPMVPIRDSLREAIEMMEGAGTDRIAVCDGTTYVGIVSAGDLIRLDDLLSEHGQDRFHSP